MIIHYADSISRAILPNLLFKSYLKSKINKLFNKILFSFALILKCAIIIVLWDQYVNKYSSIKLQLHKTFQCQVWTGHSWSGHSTGFAASKTRLAIIKLPFTQLGSKPQPGIFSPRFLGSFAGVLWLQVFICTFSIILWPADPSTFLTVARLVVLSFCIVVLQHLYYVACCLGYKECANDNSCVACKILNPHITIRGWVD